MFNLVMGLIIKITPDRETRFSRGLDLPLIFTSPIKQRGKEAREMGRFWK